MNHKYISNYCNFKCNKFDCSRLMKISVSHFAAKNQFSELHGIVGIVDLTLHEPNLQNRFPRESDQEFYILSFGRKIKILSTF